MNRLITIFFAVLLATLPATADDASRQETISTLRKLAEKGSAEAQTKLGTIYFYGHLGQQPDYALAAHWFKQAADQGTPQAQLNMGICYERGLGVEKNYETALTYYKPAADQGVLPAIINVAFAYQRAGDHKEAAKYFKGGAERGDRHCQREFGKALLTDVMGTPDPLRARRYLEQAAATGDALANLALADLYSGKFPEIKPDGRKMFNALLKAADTDNPEALSKLGYCYEEGIGVPRSTDQAVGWYKRAAERGHAAAMINLADCYRDGRGTPQNPQLAYEWYRTAASVGHAMGTFNVGVCYAMGVGVEISPGKAREHFKTAAEAGIALAQFNYAIYLQEGRGGERDTVGAAHWFKTAADAGFHKAMTALSDCYESGTGVPRNPDTAALWRRKAALAKLNE